MRVYSKLLRFCLAPQPGIEAKFFRKTVLWTANMNSSLGLLLAPTSGNLHLSQIFRDERSSQTRAQGHS